MALTHKNLAASAFNIATTLGLGPSDRCLNIMPLFHIHGFVGALASSLCAGSTVVCAPGFNALSFIRWLEESAATWFTAVPTMHQAIALRASRSFERAEQCRLRFIRSSSSPLPPQVMRDLEGVFGCPVIEAYGMTEASHQIASNPLPPGQRRPGTVGKAVGMQVQITDERGNLLAPDEVGEIVLRGPNLLGAYENDLTATERAFAHGWFHTGDQGVIDPDGYIRIIGRMTEIINRGGEKISPREVDEVLLDHPAVAQALTFGVPHPLLGEDVAAAVVLREGFPASENELITFVRERLAPFKIPDGIFFLNELPKGPTGKPQRIGLAERFRRSRQTSRP